MRGIFVSWLSLVAVVFFPGDVLRAQQTTKIIVEVTADSDDIVGRRLVYNIKEMIRKSYAMELQVHDYANTPYNDTPRIRVIVSTMCKYDDNPSIATIYSVTWTLSGAFKNEDTWCNDRYLTGTLGYCGSKRVEESAESLVAHTDEIVEVWREALEVQPYYDRK